MYDIIIIGAGPAGLTAAIYARRASKKVLVLEAKAYGGQIINTLDIDNYPAAPHISGADFAKQLYRQAKSAGAKIVYEQVLRLDTSSSAKKVVTDESTYSAGAVIIATGAEHRHLGLPGEEGLIGKGVSYCATCDGAFYHGKDVAVIGGGDSALEDALYLSGVASKVYLIHRRDEFRGESETVATLRTKPNIEFVLNSTVTSLHAGDALESIEITGRDGATQTLSVAGLFIAIGQVPTTSIFRGLLNTTPDGYIIAGEDCQTPLAGIFVAGDSRTKPVRQLVTATADGATAATAAVRYLDSQL